MTKALATAWSLVFCAVIVGSAWADGVSTVVGFKGGVNVADFSGDDVDSDDTSSRTGFVGGGFLSIMVHEAWAIQPEILYSSQGTTVEEDPDIDFAIDYFQIPILAKVMLTRGSGATPFVLTGPAFGFQTDCELSSGGVTVDCDVAGVELKNTDFAWAFGGGVTFGAGPTVLEMDVRYNLGLTSIDDAEEPGDLKHRVLALTFGVGFP